MLQHHALIPWHGPHNWQEQVMLYARRTSLAVVYHPHERKLRVRRAAVCPMCRQSISHDQPAQQDSASDAAAVRIIRTIKLMVIALW